MFYANVDLRKVLSRDRFMKIRELDQLYALYRHE